MNAIALAMKRATTLVANHLVLVFVAAAVLIALLVAIAEFRARPRR